jgi:hypothetical protein
MRHRSPDSPLTGLRGVLSRAAARLSPSWGTLLALAVASAVGAGSALFALSIGQPTPTLTPGRSGRARPGGRRDPGAAGGDRSAAGRSARRPPAAAAGRRGERELPPPCPACADERGRPDHALRAGRHRSGRRPVPRGGCRPVGLRRGGYLRPGPARAVGSPPAHGGSARPHGRVAGAGDPARPCCRRQVVRLQRGHAHPGRPGARECVNGLSGSPFGQFAYRNAPALLAAA